MFIVFTPNNVTTFIYSIRINHHYHYKWELKLDTPVITMTSSVLPQHFLINSTSSKKQERVKKDIHLLQHYKLTQLMPEEIILADLSSFSSFVYIFWLQFSNTTKFWKRISAHQIIPLSFKTGPVHSLASIYKIKL